MEYAKLYDNVTGQYYVIQRDRRNCEIDWYLWSNKQFDKDTAIVIIIGLETANGQ